MAELHDLEKAVVQLFLDEEALAYLDALREDFPSEAELKDIFARVNVNLKLLGMEIKTVILRDDRNIRHLYHGLVNMEDDFSAMEHGSAYTANEVSFFKDICIHLTNDKYMNYVDFAKFKPTSMSQSAMEALLHRFQADQWLQMTDANFWELGPRSHLELRLLIENAKLEAHNLDADAENRHEVLQELPQILYY